MDDEEIPINIVQDLDYIIEFGARQQAVTFIPISFDIEKLCLIEIHILRRNGSTKSNDLAIERAVQSHSIRKRTPIISKSQKVIVFLPNEKQGTCKHISRIGIRLIHDHSHNKRIYRTSTTTSF